MKEIGPVAGLTSSQQTPGSSSWFWVGQCIQAYLACSTDALVVVHVKTYLLKTLILKEIPICLTPVNHHLLQG